MEYRRTLQPWDFHPMVSGRRDAFKMAKNLLSRLGPMNAARGGFIPNVTADYKFDPERDMENIEGIVFNISLKLFDPNLSDRTIRRLHRQLMKTEDHLKNTCDRKAAPIDEEMAVIVKAQKMRSGLEGKEEKLNKKIIKAQQKLDELTQMKAAQEDPKTAMWKKITESTSTTGRPSEVFGIQRKVRKLRGEPKSHRMAILDAESPMTIVPPTKKVVKRRIRKTQPETPLMEVEERAPHTHFDPPPTPVPFSDNTDQDVDDLSDQIDRLHLGDGLKSTKITKRVGNTCALLKYNSRLKKFRKSHPQLSLSEARVMMGEVS